VQIKTQKTEDKRRKEKLVKLVMDNRDPKIILKHLFEQEGKMKKVSQNSHENEKNKKP